MQPVKAAIWLVLLGLAVLVATNVLATTASKARAAL